MKLSPLSEIIIKPIKSPTYLRLIMVLYVLTGCLILYYSLYEFVKILLFIFLSLRLISDCIHQQPTPEILELHCYNGIWLLLTADSNELRYKKMNILIYNSFFQCIQFSHLEKPDEKFFFKKNQFIILFNDQIPESQLRHLHLLSHI